MPSPKSSSRKSCSSLMPDLMARISDPKLTDSLLKIRELMGSMVPSRELQEKIPGFKTQKGI